MEKIIIVRGISKKFTVNRGPKKYALRNKLSQLISSRESIKKPLKILSSIWALDDISFDVNKGEVLGIVGHNGAGKSVLLKILSRITKPTYGEATIYGDVGSMLEVDSGFHPELTGRENIYMSGALIGINKSVIKSEFDTIVEMSEIGSLLDTPVKRYSDGMRVKLAFSIAYQLKPDVLILDEILAVSDKKFREKSFSKIKNLKNNGTTILLVSHNLTMINELCDRILWLKQGKIHRIGPKDLILEEYKN